MCTAPCRSAGKVCRNTAKNTAKKLQWNGQTWLIAFAEQRQICTAFTTAPCRRHVPKPHATGHKTRFAQINPQCGFSLCQARSKKDNTTMQACDMAAKHVTKWQEHNPCALTYKISQSSQLKCLKISHALESIPRLSISE